MANEAELNVKLKLEVEEAIQAAKAAFGYITKEEKRQIKESTIARQSAQREEVSASEKRGEKLSEAHWKGWRRYEQRHLPKFQQVAIPKMPEWMTRQSFLKGRSAIQPFNLKAALLGTATLPFNPWIGSRMLSDVFKGGGSGGKGGGVAAGIFGAGGAMGFAEFYIGAQLFKKAVQTFNQTVQKGFDLYTKSAQQGLNTGFFAQRQIASNVLGVGGGPNEVFRFGAAVQFVTNKTKYAAMTLSQTAKPFADFEIQMRILKVNLEALTAKAFVGVTSQLTEFVNRLNMLAVTLMKLKDITDKINKWSPVAFSSFRGYNALIDKLPGGKASSTSPSLIGGMQQLPASAWEHMGLVIGNSGSSPAQITAKNSTKQVNLLTIIAKALKGEHMQSFGFNPTVAHQ